MNDEIGRYHIEKILGSGAMGSVHLAFDPLIQRRVAIKTIRLDVIQNIKDRDEYRARFFREAQISGQINHPNVAALYDLGEADGQPFLVMEYVDGPALSQKLENGSLDRESAIRMIREGAAGLTAAHARGIVHRDLKPANLMFDSAGALKILDFGIARMGDLELTNEGEFLGTPTYSSPEQITDCELDHRSDLFAFAVVVHKALTGKDAYRAGNLDAIFRKIVQGDPSLAPPAKELGLDVGAFHEILLRALAVDPEDRYSDVAAFAAALLKLFHAPLSISEEATLKAVSPSVMGDPDTTKTLPVNDPELRREQRIRTLKTQFQEAYAADNLIAGRALVQALQRRDADFAAERLALQKLERKVQDAAVKERRNEFHHALERDDLAVAGRILRVLEDLADDVSTERTALAAKQSRRITDVQRERTALQRSVEEEDLIKAKSHLRKLHALGEHPRELAAQVEHLEREKMSEARTKLKDITALRQDFQTALTTGDLEAATLKLGNLEAERAPIEKEREALAGLRERHEDQARTHIETQRKAFKAAIRIGDIDGAETAIEATQKYDADKASTLTQQLAMYRKAQRRTTIKQLERVFEQALKTGDEPLARKTQQALAALDADSDLYRWLLRKASGKDPGPRPGRRHKTVLAAIGISIGALIWLLLRSVG